MGYLGTLDSRTNRDNPPKKARKSPAHHGKLSTTPEVRRSENFRRWKLSGVGPMRLKTGFRGRFIAARALRGYGLIAIMFRVAWSLEPLRSLEPLQPLIKVYVTQCSYSQAHNAGRLCFRHGLRCRPRGGFDCGEIIRSGIPEAPSQHTKLW